MPRPGERDWDKEQHWRDIVSRWSDSGLPKSQFCRDEGMKLSTFSEWVRKIAERDRESALALRRYERERRRRRAAARARRDSESDRNKPQKASDFVQVHVNPDQFGAATAPSMIEISCPSGLVIKLPTEFDTHALLAIISALSP